MFLKNTDTRAFSIFNSFIKLGSDDAYPSGRAMHIWYGTPTYAGFSLSGDYTPDGRSRNEEQFATDTVVAAPAAGTITQNLNETNFQNVFSINLQWKGDFGPLALAGGLQYSHGDSKHANGLVGGTEFSNAVARDINSYEAGMVANYAGFQWGLNWTGYGQTGAPKAQFTGNQIIGGSVSTWGWSTGLEYFMGPWVIGGYYWYGRAPGTWQFAAPGTAVAAGGPGEFEFNQYALGLGYTLAPGLKLYSEAYYYDDHNTHVVSQVGNSGRHMSGQIYIFGTSVAW